MAIRNRSSYFSFRSISVKDDLVKPVYDTVFRPYLPRKTGTYNGVPVRNLRLFDLTTSNPDYEDPLINGVRQAVNPGDNVTIIGGGLGVTTVIAATETGPGGEVIVYEANKQMLERTRETIRMNEVDDRVSLHHGLVGPSIRVYKNGPNGATKTHPAHLSETDVLELDCEGAEANIIPNLTMSPRAIIVEYHEEYGVPRQLIEKQLTDRQYDTKFIGIEDEKKGVGVLLGIS